MTRRYLTIVCLILFIAPIARGDEPSSSATIATPRHKFTPYQKVDRSPGKTSTGSGGWWIGSITLALVLGSLGAVSLAARRFLPSGDTTNTLQVVGRTGLSPKHSVYLLRVGERVLIVGTGAQGAPSLLGELDDPDEITRLTTARKSSTLRVPAPVSRLLHSVARPVGSVS